jgi:hypothetical protein
MGTKETAAANLEALWETAAKAKDPTKELEKAHAFHTQQSRDYRSKAYALSKQGRKFFPQASSHHTLADVHGKAAGFYKQALEAHHAGKTEDRDRYYAIAKSKADNAAELSKNLKG